MPNISKVRIIGGKWRSRKITFLNQPDLRPTTDRVRETLFNWLREDLATANCLDLFAGSGALGFEALSRGAKQVLMIDKTYHVIRLLEDNAKILAATNCSFLCAYLPRDFKKISQQKFNIVFIDAPFRQKLIGICCEKLLEFNLLAPSALIYIEAERELDLVSIVPKSFENFREKTAGSVRFSLWRACSTNSP